MIHHKCKLLQDSISHLPKLLPNATWLERLRRKFRKLFLVSINHPEVFTYLKSRAAVEKESKRQVDASKFIIHPLSDFRKYWKVLIFFMMLLNQMLIAFVIGFFLDFDNFTIQALTIIDFFICTILLVEIIISFRTGYIVTETNEIIIDPITIARKNKKNFIFDLICIQPYIFIMTFIIDEKNLIVNDVSIAFTLFLFALTIYRFNRIVFYFSSIPIILNLSEKASIIVMICMRTIYFWHWAACIRRLIPLYVEHNNSTYKSVWRATKIVSKFYVRRMSIVDDFDSSLTNDIIVSDSNVISNNTILHKYMRTMMITLKLSMQSGYGMETSDSILNMLMTIFIMLNGWIYSTYALILISNIIIASAVSENKFQELSNEIDAFTDSKGLSDELKSRIGVFLERKFQNHYFNEEAIKQSTAKCLRKEILMNSCSNLLARVPLFKKIPQNVLEDVISHLQFEIYFPDDVIIEADTVGNSMFFIAYGSAIVISSSGKFLNE